MPVAVYLGAYKAEELPAQRCYGSAAFGTVSIVATTIDSVPFELEVGIGAS